MSLWLLPALGVWPLLCAALVQSGRLWWLPAVGALPALAAALLVPVGSRLELPWLLLGTTLGMDELSRVYLLFTAVLWLAAGVHAAFSLRGREHARRFSGLFLLAMAGNFWLIVGQDLVSFYLGFAMMGLSSYGLVIHTGEASALRAGKVYLVMALLGEVTLFAALVLIAQHAGTILPRPEQLADLDDLTIALTILGLAVKAGMAPLHLWLPLAHPAAPIPASAVLSGTMIKVAVLGWLRFLPIGVAVLADWGAMLTFAGLATMCLALPVGLMQSDPKVILAYSSIAKMGVLILLLGTILADPALAPLGVAGMTLYVAHHALVKGGLFLGLGLRKYAALGQPLVLTGLVFLALAMAGAPLTSGAVAKQGVEPLLASAQWPWIATAVGVSAVATTLLMTRFLWVTAHLERHPESGYAWPSVAWIALLLLVLLFPFVLGAPHDWLVKPMPLILGILIAVAVLAITRRRPALARVVIDRVPPGDLLVLAAPIGRAGAWLLRAVSGGLATAYSGAMTRLSRVYSGVIDQPAGDSERTLREWPIAGSLWLAIGALLLVSVTGLAPSLQPEAPEVDAVAEAEPMAEAGIELPPRPLEEPQRAEAPDAKSSTEDDDLVLDERVEATEVAEIDSGQSALVEPTPTAVTPARTQVTDTTAQARASEACDPADPLVLISPLRPNERIVLAPCKAGAAGGAPQLIDAPDLTNALVLMVQEYLWTLGMDPGPRDGLIGPQTRGAIRDFERSQAVPERGALDFDLLERLHQAWTAQAKNRP
ncbi:NADH/ubiquinone/plastoquinone (complex I) [Thiorhodococcus mannitoliphagus]|uniref:NADH/ubiquinone/plastoquinone (Complex I) n=1 Tax=Thiorhodococcus mannitoliphagus TaxID=329406 RepID=A0A6P1DM18_9GAMM|nr:proton-conducting transporter membrane subunit [Thiorhodococcus mannitoliphagus]NEX18959.1 NADH/ubiquinone/plastoquinone (complex I) [Thiorhodococcus mannitoliphagus]